MKAVLLLTIEGNLTGPIRLQDQIKVQFQLLGFRCFIFKHSMSKGLPSTSGLHESGQSQAPVQAPFQASLPQQMGVGVPPGSHMSAKSGNIQQLDHYVGQNFEKLKSTVSQAQSIAAGISGGNSVPQGANSSSSRNVERKDSMNTGMASLSLADSQPHIPTHRYPPTSFSSDRQIGSNLTDKIGSLNPSTSNLSPFNNAVQHGSHLNPSLAPLMKEPVMGNSNRSVHQTKTNPFNERDNTIRDFSVRVSDNSSIDSRGKHSGSFIP